MSTDSYNTFDINVLQEKEPVIVSSENALKNVSPIKWDDKVTSEQTKVLLVAEGDS